MDWTPIILSVKLSVVTTVILGFIGLPLAYWLAQGNSIWKIVIEALLTMPLVLPPSVLGFYLLLAFSPQGWLGKNLNEVFDIQLVFSFKGLVLASVIYSLPFMVGPIKSAFVRMPRSIIEASYTMGKSELATFIHISVPVVKPAIVTASVLSFAHTMGEFGIVLMIGGNIPGVTQVGSVAVYNAVEQMDYITAGSHASVLFAISFAIVLLVFVINRHIAKSPLE
ncbi:molybdate ABC transporter permease subunit [Olivibacter sitiensis]|uniref:molybdate ABC transporter permease subunit n=1 Tax=Olivibacter sitiensis TaxID=376470 RepID=UPI000425ECB8|nr:molybdate ABC transporter permease subunit [Olivibacter sitiensis]